MTLKWKTSTSGPTTTKSELIEGMGIGVDHEKFGEENLTHWCVSGVINAPQVLHTFVW
jgi:hypothetical protein